MVAHNRLPSLPAARRHGRARAWPATARTRSPAVTMPARFSGSARADHEAAAVGRRAPHFAQPLDGVGERELFARHARDEAAAANFAARLEAAVDARQLAPRRDVRFAREQAPEDDAVAAEQRRAPAPRRRRRATARRRRRDASIDQRPATCGRPVGADTRAPAARTSARRPPKPSEAMRPAATSSPSARADARVVQAAGGRQLVDERGAAAAQHREHGCRRRTAAPCRGWTAAPCRSRRRLSAPPRSRACSRRNSATGVAPTTCVTSPLPPTAAPSRLRRSGTACRASTARSRRRAPAGRCAPRRRPRARSRRAPRRRPAGRRCRSAGSTDATCCQANRNRMKSAGLTGSISARRRLSV